MDSSLYYEINSSQIIHQTIDDEVIIVNLESGSYYSLEKVGADIWNLIARGSTLPGIVEQITRRYDCGPEKAGSAVRHFVQELQHESLLLPVHGNEQEEERLVDEHPEPGMEQEAFEPPAFHKYTDMQDLLLLDPIHEVSDTGWPTPKSVEEP